MGQDDRQHNSKVFNGKQNFGFLNDDNKRGQLCCQMYKNTHYRNITFKFPLPKILLFLFISLCDYCTLVCLYTRILARHSLHTKKEKNTSKVEGVYKRVKEL